MGRDLVHRINDFRDRTIGRDLSTKYFPRENPLKDVEMSNSDCIKALLRSFGKSALPYYGDKLIMEWSELEGEIKPEEKRAFLFRGIGLIIAKYALYWSILDKALY